MGDLQLKAFPVLPSWLLEPCCQGDRLTTNLSEDNWKKRKKNPSYHETIHGSLAVNGASFGEEMSKPFKKKSIEVRDVDAPAHSMSHWRERKEACQEQKQNVCKHSHMPRRTNYAISCFDGPLPHLSQSNHRV